MPSVGQWVVYPAHGVGRVTAIEPPSASSEELYRIHFERDKMTIFVPTRHKDRIRALTKKSALEKALHELTRVRVKSKRFWHLREVGYRGQLHSGDISQLAELARNLFVPEGVQQSYSEREIYDAALERLADEVALVLDLPLQGMRGLIESTIIHRKIAPELERALNQT